MIRVDEIAHKIFELTGVNFVANTRKRKETDIRAFFCYLLKDKYEFTQEEINEELNDLGIKRNRSNVSHSISKIKTMVKNGIKERYLIDLFIEFYPNKEVTKTLVKKIDSEKKQNNNSKFNKKILSLTKNLNSKQQNEIIETLTLKINSYTWKN